MLDLIRKAIALVVVAAFIGLVLALIWEGVRVTEMQVATLIASNSI